MCFDGIMMEQNAIEVQLQQIRDEVATGGNTRERVYNALKALLDYAASIEVGGAKAIVPALGEVFFGDDEFRRLNYVVSYESDASSIGVEVFAFRPIRTAKLNNITAVSNSLFKGSNYTYGSFNAATTIEISAFADTQLYYINKSGAKDEHNTLLPNVTAIKSHAFAGCKSLMEVYLPTATSVSYWVFQNCTRLTKLELPNCVSFGFNAVAGCTALEELNLPMQQTVWNHSYNRLFGCTGLKKVSLPMMYEINENVGNLFLDCVALEEVDIRSLKLVPSYFFANKNRLHTVDITSARWIGRCAFENCVNLKTITMNYAYRIDEYAFNNCTRLANLNMPAANNLAHKALANMDSLTTLTFGSNIVGWSYSTVGGSVYNCTSLTVINVPDNWSIPTTGISFVGCPNISKDSVVAMFTKLADNTGKSAKNIALEASVLKAISEEELKIVRDKNYNIVRLGS